MGQSETAQPPTSVECPIDKDYRLRFFILAGMPLAFGLWCIIDVALRKKYPRPEEEASINDWLTWGFNHYGQFVFTALGLLVLFAGIRAARRVLVADNAGVGWKGKPKLPWSEVTGLDTSKFERKQILYLLSGETRFILDGYKLRNFKQLVQMVEQHVDPSLVHTGEAPEPPVDTQDQDE